jgi:alkylated DNA repair dioxygenase AlkB
VSGVTREHTFDMRQAALFASLEEPVQLIAEGGDVTYYPGFLEFEEGDALVAELLATTRFSADSRLMYGKRVAVPRETAGRGDRMSQPWSPLLLAVRERLETLLATGFDYVFVNRYRDGRDSVAWHGDHEISGKVVASLSLGATREFDLRQRTIALDVAHGDLVVMRGETQRFWEHRVRKDPLVHEQRINLTFRQHHVRPSSLLSP